MELQKHVPLFKTGRPWTVHSSSGHLNKVEALHSESSLLALGYIFNHQNVAKNPGPQAWILDKEDSLGFDSIMLMKPNSEKHIG